MNAAAAEDIGPARRILIVEDDDAVAGSLAEVLADEGYEAAIAGNGQLALDWLQRNEPPQLILLDLWMPVLTGDEFRQQQLQDAALARIPVIIISAAADASARGRNLGAAAVLTKPVDLDRLLELVDKHALH